MLSGCSNDVWETQSDQSPRTRGPNSALSSQWEIFGENRVWEHGWQALVGTFYFSYWKIIQYLEYGWKLSSLHKSKRLKPYFEAMTSLSFGEKFPLLTNVQLTTKYNIEHFEKINTAKPVPSSVTY